MKKIIIVSILTCFPLHSYATLDNCRSSYNTCPIDPTNNTHKILNDQKTNWDIIYGNSNIQLPYAFATEDYKHLLKTNNNSCYVCGGINNSCGHQDVVAIIDQGRVIDFYKCVTEHSLLSGMYFPSRSGWRKVDNEVDNTKPCKGNLFHITSEPTNHGGKAYYFGSGDGRGYSYQDGNNVFSLDDIEKICYYYYCDDGYIYSPDKGTCVSKQAILAIISEMEETVNTAKDLTPEQKTQYQSKIKLLKQKFGLE